MNAARKTLIGCPECDLLQYAPPPPIQGVVRCCRCGATLFRLHPQGLERALAFYLGTLILFVIANVFPIVGLTINGEYIQTTLIGAAKVMYSADMVLVAGLVLVTTFAAPLMQILTMIYLLLPAYCRRRPPHAQLIFRSLTVVRPWGMVEVFVVGVLVSLVKLAHLATVIPGIALWGFGGVMLLMAAAVSSFDARELWARLESFQ